MYKVLSKKGYFLYVSVILLTLYSCDFKKKNAEQIRAHKYGILINAKSGERSNDRILWVNSLDTGEINTEQNSIDISSKLGSSIVMRDGYLFNFDKHTHLLTKFSYDEHQLVDKGSVKLKDFDIISYTVNLDSTLLYISASTYIGANSYLIINSKTMKQVKKGVLHLPIANRQLLKDNFGWLANHKLYIAYSSFDENYDFCSDTSYMAVLDYPGFGHPKISKDTRSAFPGTGINGLFNSFEDKTGNIYVLTSPVFYHGNHPTAPTAFYRLSKGKYAFDQDYFFDLSALAKGSHLLGIAYAGNGKVILATSSYPSTGNSDYYVADVYDKTLKLLLKKQHVPNYIWGTSGFTEGENAYFIVNIKDNLAQIYRYNSSTGELKKGAVIKGIVSEKSSYKIFTSPFRQEKIQQH